MDGIVFWDAPAHTWVVYAVVSITFVNMNSDKLFIISEVILQIQQNILAEQQTWGRESIGDSKFDLREKGPLNEKLLFFGGYFIWYNSLLPRCILNLPNEFYMHSQLSKINKNGQKWLLHYR